MEHSITIEYNNFMKWFKENYPELHEKYGRNIGVPFQIGEGVSVNNSFKISEDEYQTLLKVARKYYETK